jgi:coproporphyrinogen III oxidase-like Fe-S oxidoreductase
MTSDDIAVLKIHPRLPVHRVSTSNGTLLYVPPGKFIMLSPREAANADRTWHRATMESKRNTKLSDRKRSWCEENAKAIEAARREATKATFTPSCLSIYMSNSCNCRCTYCFSESLSPQERDGSESLPIVSLEAVAAGARLVAKGCRKIGRSFFLVIHGSGEPTVHWDLLVRIYATAARIASEFDLDFKSHIATNGIISEKQAQWLALNFNHIGISCDGPPHIHDRQRVLLNGKASSPIVERTAALIKKYGGYTEARSTITPDSLRYQSEIAEYLCSTLHVDELRFEPSYALGSTGAPFPVRDAGLFVEHFIKAQHVALSYGRQLVFSGVRIDEMHGPFCDVARDTLRLLPDGTVSGCFSRINGNDCNSIYCNLGGYNRQSDSIVLDTNRIAEMRRRAFTVPARCRKCINAYHCSRGCPEFCIVTNFLGLSGSARTKLKFRCRVHRLLTYNWLGEILAQPTLHLASLPEYGSRPLGLGRYENTIDTYRHGYLRYPIESRSLPEPIWSRFGYSETGTDAWNRIIEKFRQTTVSAPNSIYIHIPFCRSRCGFCDCLSTPLRKNGEKPFIDALLKEIALWRAIIPLHKSPVSTVHFGGGTPTCLSFTGIDRIVNALKKHFAISDTTELAFESTSAELNTENIRQLRSIGFSRIHIGVQSLDSAVRARIGRISQADQVIKSIHASLYSGAITSVDLVYGLPGQSKKSFMESVIRVCTEKVHGVSLYRFNQSSRNKAFVKRFAGFTQDAKSDYNSFLRADDLLAQNGYSKNHFVHYALPEDLNLYYTHVLRGENLVSLGPTSDGVISHYNYRHCDIEDYTSFDFSRSPGLCGGIEKPVWLQSIDRLTTELMCCRAVRKIYESSGFGGLFNEWVLGGLLTCTGTDGIYSLSGRGSWFINNMIMELERNHSDLCAK